MKDPNVKKALSKFEKSYKETQKYNKEVQDWIKKYRDEKIKKAGKQINGIVSKRRKRIKRYSEAKS